MTDLSILTAALLASLAGSLHCVGMCGPIVAFYTGADQSQGRRSLLSHLVYNGARLLTVLGLGAAAGTAGAALDAAGRSWASLQHTALIVAGVVMVLWGLALLLAILGVRRGRLALPPALQQLGARLMRLAADRPPLARTAVLGLLTPFLPCGWLWAFLLVAAARGDAVGGALVMGAFWLGSVPALLGLGAGLHWLYRPLRRYLPLVTALLLITVGVLAITGRFAIVGRKPPAKMVDAVRAGEAPSKACCHGKR